MAMNSRIRNDMPSKKATTLKRPKVVLSRLNILITICAAKLVKSAGFSAGGV